MKPIQRWGALLLSLLMLASLCTSCGGSPDPTKTPEQPSATETVPGDATPEPTEEPSAASALDIMRRYNTQLPQNFGDKYRTCYEVFVYSFEDSDGDGIGDLPGLTSKLDYINDGDPATDTDLGCTGIWLMPIMPSPSYHKYDVTGYYGIDPAYGTMEDFKTFLAQCHERGVAVIIDLVMNHTSSEHPWFKAAAEYLRTLGPDEEPNLEECPTFEYYNFSRETSTCKLEGTDWYYEAPFWSGMPDLNLENEAVRGEIEKIVDYWLDIGVDGFRLDAAKEFVSGATMTNTAILTWFNDMVKSKKEDAYIVAEVWTDLNTYSNYYGSGIDSCFNFYFGDSDGVIPNTVKHTGANASSYGTAIQRLQETLSAVNPNYIDAPFYTNHDMGRSAGHYFMPDTAESQMKMGQALNLLMSGCSFTYYGEEIGMKGSGKDENKRAPMYWSADPSTPGMCKGPADMDQFDMKYPPLEEQMADGNSIWNFVVQAMRLREAYHAISRGTAVFEESLSGENICVLRKTYTGGTDAGTDSPEEVVLVLNISDTPETVNLSGLTVAGQTPAIGGVLVSSPEEPALENGTLSIPAYSAVVLTPGN